MTLFYKYKQEGAGTMYLLSCSLRKELTPRCLSHPVEEQGEPLPLHANPQASSLATQFPGWRQPRHGFEGLFYVRATPHKAVMGPEVLF